MRVTTYDVGQYRATLTVVYGRQKDLGKVTTRSPEVTRVIRSWADTSDKIAGRAGFRATHGVQTWVIFVEEKQSRRQRMLTSIHEAAHMGAYVMDYIGHDVLHGGDEPFAYLTEWIADVTMKGCGV